MINVLEEIHWDDQRKFYATPIEKTAIHRIVFLDLLVFFFVMIPYALIYFRSFQGQVDLQFWASLPLYTVLTVGAFGAYFSRLIEILQNGDKLSIRELQTSKSWSSLFLRGAVGMCGALVVFFFLKSGLIGGGMFPDFTKLGFDFKDYPAVVDDADKAKLAANIMRTIEPSQNLALLAMWSFLAGFSERLVPTILRTPKRLSQIRQVALLAVRTNDSVALSARYGRASTSNGRHDPRGAGGDAIA